MLQLDKSMGISPVTVTLLIFFLLIHQATPENSDLSINSTSSEEQVTTILATLLPTTSPTATAIPQVNYDCLPTCKCIYDKENAYLEISCPYQLLPTTKSNESVNFVLANGVRKLVLKNVELKKKSLVIPLLAENTLVELELRNVTLDPMEFFNSHLLKNCGNSLEKIFLSQGQITTTSEVFSMDYREKLNAFATLGSLDSLVVCDSNPLLSQIILQALPDDLHHIHVVNNTMSDIYYYAFSHLTSLQSLNLSQNHLSRIPNGLLNNLKSLKSLDISFNKLQHLQEDIFTGLSALRKLDLSHNSIEYVDAEVFTQLEDLQIVDLSNNKVIQFFEPYFQHNNNLRLINMSNTWVSFINENTASRSYREMEGLISTLRSVQVLDLSDNSMTIIPETLSHVPRLRHVYLNGNPWECSCNDRWILDWLSFSNVSLGQEEEENNKTEGAVACVPQNEGGQSFPMIPYMQNLALTCNSSNIDARYPFKYYAVMGKDKVMNCHTRISTMPRITWITPSKRQITLPLNYSSVHQIEHDWDHKLEPTIYPDGALLIHNVEPTDYGLYLCVASYEDLNITHYVHLGMDVAIFEEVKFMSIIVGLTFSFGFLFLVLLGHLIKFLLLRSGLKCIAVRTANQSRRVRAFFDSIEQNKNNQLEWLRQNYNMQSKKIQDNCIFQLERIRESYTSQTKNLSEFRDYSTQQLTTMRDQYQDQIRKVASYSALRLGKVRENYVFNRNRVGKFSSHQLIRLREAYKWQAQAVNKILENLPQGLNLDSCRGVGACGRTDSIYLNDEDMEEFLAHSSASASTSQRSKVSNGDDNEHISLLIPPEFLASYLISPIPNSEQQATLLADILRNQSLPRVGDQGDFNMEQKAHSSKSFYNHQHVPFADEDV